MIYVVRSDMCLLIRIVFFHYVTCACYCVCLKMRVGFVLDIPRSLLKNILSENESGTCIRHSTLSFSKTSFELTLSFFCS